MERLARKLTLFSPPLTERRQITLLELVAAVADEADSEAEVVATVAHLIDTRQVELIGNFCCEDVEVA